MKVSHSMCGPHKDNGIIFAPVRHLPGLAVLEVHQGLLPKLGEDVRKIRCRQLSKTSTQVLCKAITFLACRYGKGMISYY